MRQTFGQAGVAIGFMGDWERAKALLEKARRLNPNHPPWMYWSDYYDRLRAGDYENALDQAHKSLIPGNFWTYMMLGAAYGQLGRETEAQAAVAKLDELNPGYTLAGVEQFHRKWNFQDDVIFQIIEGLRKAGLPEGPDAQINSE